MSSEELPWKFHMIHCHVIHCLSSARERGLRNRQCAVEVLTLNSAQHYSLRDLTWKCCLGQSPLSAVPNTPHSWDSGL